MAGLQVVIGKEAYDHTTKTITINDVTGDWVDTSNEGGYGSPNPERNTLGVFLIKETIVFGGSTSNDIKRYKQDFIIGADPQADVSWKEDIRADGIYGFNLVAVDYFADEASITGASRYVMVGSYLVDGIDVGATVGLWDTVNFNLIEEIDFSVLTTGYTTGYVDFDEEFVDKYTEEYLMKQVLNSRANQCLCREIDYRIESVFNASKIAYLNNDNIKAQDNINCVELLKMTEVVVEE